MEEVKYGYIVVYKNDGYRSSCGDLFTKANITQSWSIWLAADSSIAEFTLIHNGKPGKTAYSGDPLEDEHFPDLYFEHSIKPKSEIEI